MDNRELLTEELFFEQIKKANKKQKKEKQLENGDFLEELGIEWVN